MYSCIHLKVLSVLKRVPLVIAGGQNLFCFFWLRYQAIISCNYFESCYRWNSELFSLKQNSLFKFRLQPSGAGWGRVAVEDQAPWNESKEQMVEEEGEGDTAESAQLIQATGGFLDSHTTAEAGEAARSGLGGGHMCTLGKKLLPGPFKNESRAAERWQW